MAFDKRNPMTRHRPSNARPFALSGWSLQRKLVLAFWLLAAGLWGLVHGWIVPRVDEFRPQLETFTGSLPLAAPQWLGYTLYRWENNIRAAAVLGVVGAGGLGQMLAFHMGLFQMGETSSVLVAMLALVALVDALSFASRRWLAI